MKQAEIYQQVSHLLSVADDLGVWRGVASALRDERGRIRRSF